MSSRIKNVFDGHRPAETSETGSPTGLVKYDAMCRAIDTAYEVDEVKEIRNEARAWEIYSQQAHNVEAERRACEIRLRAERRAGQILKTMEKAKGARGNPGGRGAPVVRSDDATAQTLEQLGISKQQSSDWQKLADMPEAEFEAGLAEATKPTTRGLIDPPKVTPVSDKALRLWGILQDFYRLGIIHGPSADCLSTMTEPMVEDVLHLAPQVAEWISTIQGVRTTDQASKAESIAPRLKLSDLETAEIMGARASLIMVGKRVQNIAVPKLHAAIEAACHIAREYIDPS